MFFFSILKFNLKLIIIIIIISIIITFVKSHNVRRLFLALVDGKMLPTAGANLSYLSIVRVILCHVILNTADNSNPESDLGQDKKYVVWNMVSAP